MKNWYWLTILLLPLFLTACGVECNEIDKNRWLMECQADDPVSRWAAKRMLRKTAKKLRHGYWSVKISDEEVRVADGSYIELVRVLDDGQEDTLKLDLKQDGDKIRLMDSNLLLPWLVEQVDQLQKIRADMRKILFEGKIFGKEGDLELVYTQIKREKGEVD